MERPPSDRPVPPDSKETRPDAGIVREEDRPYGAIIVTTVVAVAILVSWFGVYFLNLVRS